MRQPITAEDQKRMLEATTKVAALVDDGLHPNDAVVKVAKDMGLQPGAIHLLCTAVNSGRQTAQRKQASDILEKLAPFELADSTTVIDRLYPPTQKKAAVVEVATGHVPHYSQRAAKQVKAANSCSAPTKPKKPMYSEKDVAQIRRGVKAAEAVVASSEAKLDRAGTYWRLYCQAHPETHLSDLAKTAMAKADDQGVSAILSAFELAGKPAVVDTLVKLASTDNPGYLSVIRTPAAELSAGLQLLSQLVQAADNRVKAAALLASYEAEKALAEEAYHGQLKVALVNPAEMTGLPDPSEDYEAKVQDALSVLEDPSHLRNLSNIRTTAMLNKLMTDPSDPISGADPVRVLHEFNTIAQMAPRLATQPALLAPILRRRIGALPETFEGKEIAETEKVLAGLDRPGDSK